jgi:hypothetical protein
MKAYSLSHLDDHVLLHDLRALVAQDRTTTAAMLAHLAEVDTRKLYLPAAYASMYLYCVGELRLSEDAAFKRIRAARAARQCPAIFAAVADGSLNLSAIVMLAPYLTKENASELLSAAARKTRPELELLLANRFPQPDVATQVRAIMPAVVAVTQAPLAAPVMDLSCQLAPGPVVYNPEQAPTREQASGAPGMSFPPRPKLTPLAPERFALQVTIGQATHDKLRRAQELLAHSLPSGDVAQVLDRALDELIVVLERRRLAATDRPRARRSAANKRYIPADVKRKVRKRDGDQCTFRSEAGRRCTERRFLEFDHTKPVARGGRSTVGGLRLRCRAHNQHEAERMFGKGFMGEKRQEARRKAARACEPAPARLAKEPVPEAAAPAAPA